MSFRNMHVLKFSFIQNNIVSWIRKYVYISIYIYISTFPQVNATHIWINALMLSNETMASFVLIALMCQTKWIEYSISIACLPPFTPGHLNWCLWWLNIVDASRNPLQFSSVILLLHLLYHCKYPNTVITYRTNTWWRHQMEASARYWPVTRRFDVSFDLRLNKRLSKQLICRWFETPSCSLWRHYN